MTSEDNQISREPIQVRTRRPIYLDRLTPRASVAFIDKLQLRFARTEILFNAPNTPRTLHEALPRYEVNGAQLFSRKRAYGRTYRLEIKQEWLFKGAVIFEQRNDTRASVILDLKLNCARFINHLSHQYTEQDAIEQVRALPPEVLLRKQDSLEYELKRETLDNSDNYVNFGANLVSYAELDELIQLYINAVVSLVLGALQVGGGMHISVADVENLTEIGINPEWDNRWFLSLSDIADNAGTIHYDRDAILLPNLSEWTIKNTEVYFDVFIQDALSFLHATTPYWKAILSNAQMYDYGAPNQQAIPEDILISEGYDINSISIVGNLRREVSLGIYAKRFNGLRLEVRYHQETIRNIIAVTTSEIGSAYSDILPMLNRLMQDATGKIVGVEPAPGRRRREGLLSGIPDEIKQRFNAREMVSVAHYTGLLTAIHQQSPTPEIFNEIVQGCLMRGFINVRSRVPAHDTHNTELKQALKSIGEKHFIETGFRSGNYRFRKFTLRPQYYYSFQALSAAFSDVVEAEMSEATPIHTSN